MMSNKEGFSYKGYTGSADVSINDKCLYGKIKNIDALVTYEGVDFDSLEKAFKESVDAYLDLCKQNGIEPEKEYSGQFKFRPGKELHRALAQFASRHNESINEVTCKACISYLEDEMKDR